jgi:hypothetical protein
MPVPPPSAPLPGVRKRSRWPRRILIAAVVLVALGTGARLIAPTVLRRAINHRLDRIPGYGGHVEAIGLEVWRGAYRIYHIEIVQRSGKVREPFFTAKQIDFSLAWGELFHGKVVSNIEVTDGQLIFLRGPTQETSQLTADQRWQDVINDLFPIDITHLVINGGIIEFIDTTHQPKVDIAIRDIKVVATGLQNRPAEKGLEYPATIDISGRSIGDGDLRLHAKLEPLADQPHFLANLELKKVSLPSLNDLMRAYAGIDVSRGQFELFGQIAMQKGHYEGYVKPFLDHVDFKGFDDKNKDLGQKLWKDIVAGVAELFKNRSTKQLATRIPFSGDAKKMDVGTLRTILNGLHHGFIKALPQGFEGTTHPDDRKSTLPAVAPKPRAAPKPVVPKIPPPPDASARAGLPRPPLVALY